MTAMVMNKLVQRLLPRDNIVARSAIGFEIAQQSLNMVQLEQSSSGKIRVNAWSSQALPEEREALLQEPRALKALLQDAFKANKFHGQAVNAMLPASQLKIMSVNYSSEEGQSADHAIAGLLQERLDGDLSDYVIDYLPVRRKDQSQRGLAVVAVARRATVINFLDCLDKAGLSINVLDIGPAAIKRLVSAMHHPKAAETVLVINFGTRNSYLSIISGRRLLFDEEFAFGEETLIAHLSEVLELEPALLQAQLRETGLGEERATDADHLQADVSHTLHQILRPRLNAIVDNVKRAMVYAVSETRGEPIAQIYLAGSLARWPGIDRILHRLLELPVSVLPDPLQTFAEIDSKAVGSPELALATGLALRDIDCHG